MRGLRYLAKLIGLRETAICIKDRMLRWNKMKEGTIPFICRFRPRLLTRKWFRDIITIPPILFRLLSSRYILLYTSIMFTGIVEVTDSKSPSSLLNRHSSQLKLTQPAVTRLEKQDDSAAGGDGISLTISNCAEILTDAHLDDNININDMPTSSKLFKFNRLSPSPFRPISTLLIPPLTCLPQTQNTCLIIISFTPTHFTVGVFLEILRRTNLDFLILFFSVKLERVVNAITRIDEHFVQKYIDTIAKIVFVTSNKNNLIFKLKPKKKKMLRYIIKKRYIIFNKTSLTITIVNNKNKW